MKTGFPSLRFWSGTAAELRLRGTVLVWVLASVFVVGLALAGGGGIARARLQHDDQTLRARALKAGGAVAQQELLLERSAQRYLLTGDIDSLVQLQEAEEGIKQALDSGAALTQELAPWSPELVTLLAMVRARLWTWRSAYLMPAIEYRLASRWDDLDRFNRRDGHARRISDVDSAIRDFRARLTIAVEARAAAHAPRSTAASFLVLFGVLFMAGALIPVIPFGLRSLSALRDRSRMSIALKNFTSDIRATSDATQFTNTIALAAMAADGVNHCNVLLSRAGGKGLSLANSVGRQPADRRISAVLDQPALCPVMTSGRPHLVGNVKTQRVCDCPLGVPDRGAYSCIPLISQDRAYGLVNVQSDAPRAMHHEHIRDYIDALGFIGSLALASHQDLSRMERDAMTDVLTGVYNRRFLDASLKLQIASASRSATSLSILMMDLDHFKRFNDVNGHSAGDTLLQSFGGCIRTVFRETDILARYGGEEFVAVLPDTDTDQAAELGERLRRQVRTLVLPGLETLPAPVVTISIGVGSYPDDGVSVEDVMRAADLAMYQAKNSGRDQIGRSVAANRSRTA